MSRQDAVVAIERWCENQSHYHIQRRPFYFCNSTRPRCYQRTHQECKLTGLGFNGYSSRKESYGHIGEERFGEAAWKSDTVRKAGRLFRRSPSSDSEKP